MLDVSVGGAGLELPGRVSAGDFVRLRMQVPVDGVGTWIDPDALVVRVEQTPMGASIVGLTFVGVPSAGLKVLSNYIASHERPKAVGKPEIVRAPQPPVQRTKPAPRPVPKPRPAKPVSRARATDDDTRAKRSELRDLFQKALTDLDDDPRKRR